MVHVSRTGQISFMSLILFELVVVSSHGQYNEQQVAVFYQDDDQTLAAYGELEKDASKQCINKLFDGVNCDGLTLDYQVKLAIRLLNCYADSFGSKKTKCTDTMKVKDCMNALDPADQPMIKNWARDMISLCRHCTNDNWLNKVHMTMLNLTRNSVQAVDKMKVIGDMLMSMGKKMEMSQEQQRKMEQTQAQMEISLKTLTDKQQQAINEQKKSMQDISRLGSDIKVDMEDSHKKMQKLQDQQSEVMKQTSDLHTNMQDSMQSIINQTNKSNQHMSKIITQQEEMVDKAKVIKDRLDDTSKDQMKLKENLGDISIHQKSIVNSQQEIIKRQSDVASELKKSITSIGEDTTNIQRGMKTSLENENDLIERQKTMHQEMQQLNVDVQQVTEKSMEQLEKLKGKTNEVSQQLQQQQKFLENMFRTIFEWLTRIFDGNLNIQSQILSLRSIVFYIVFLFGTLIVTSTNKTVSARAWIFFQTVIALFFEHYGQRFILSHFQSFRGNNEKSDTVTVIASILRYKDYEKENNKLFQRLIKMLTDLKQRTVGAYYDSYSDEIEEGETPRHNWRDFFTPQSLTPSSNQSPMNILLPYTTGILPTPSHNMQREPQVIQTPKV
ncbi:MAG: hypothetical protein EZS28_017906 [Streblomastix strix]|uniref:Uncharacterized protein n=1 Tax=Streblomastix strix TaxID=222440 RepID=A0A5J4VVH5_9EUKA|nr:MAG: hypothetical protein EZS28_017906 [Streblomastix strix]